MVYIDFKTEGQFTGQQTTLIIIFHFVFQLNRQYALFLRITEIGAEVCFFESTQSNQIYSAKVLGVYPKY